MRTPIAKKSAAGRSKPISAERLVNMYPEIAPQEGKSQVVVQGCPGAILFSTIEDAIPE